MSKWVAGRRREIDRLTKFRQDGMQGTVPCAPGVLDEASAWLGRLCKGRGGRKEAVILPEGVRAVPDTRKACHLESGTPL